MLWIYIRQQAMICRIVMSEKVWRSCHVLVVSVFTAEAVEENVIVTWGIIMYLGWHLTVSLLQKKEKEIIFRISVFHSSAWALVLGKQHCCLLLEGWSSWQHKKNSVERYKCVSRKFPHLHVFSVDQKKQEKDHCEASSLSIWWVE